MITYGHNHPLLWGSPGTSWTVGAHANASTVSNESGSKGGTRTGSPHRGQGRRRPDSPAAARSEERQVGQSNRTIERVWSVGISGSGGENGTT